MKSVLFAVGCAVTSLSIAAQSIQHRALEVSSETESPLGMNSVAQNPVEIKSGIQSSLGITSAASRPNEVASNHIRVGVASDWTEHRVLFPTSKSLAVTTRLQSDPRYSRSFLLRHREIWWPGAGRGRLRNSVPAKRDWNTPLGFTGPNYTITGVTQVGTAVTVTTLTNHVFIPGESLLISGVTLGSGGCTSAAASAIDGVQTTVTAPGFLQQFTFTSSQSATIAGGQCTIAATASAVGPTPFEPIYDFLFNVGNESLETGFGAVNTFNLSDENISTNGCCSFYAGYQTTAGTLTLTSNLATLAPQETYPQIMGPDNPYVFVDATLFPGYPSTTFPIDDPGIGFTDSSLNEYQLLFPSTTEFQTVYSLAGTFKSNSRDPLAPIILTFNNDPGGGQTYPAKYTFDVTEAPSCPNDFVAIGIPANAVAGAQANIVGYNNLYTPTDGTSDTCTGTGPTVMFAYASGTGEVPGSLSLSETGTQLAYVEDLLSGSSVFHVLTIGTNTGSEGTSPIDPVTPGASGSNAVDTTVALSGGSGSCAAQSSTTSPYIDYTDNAAYVTTYAWTGAGIGTGCLYKIINVFGDTGPIVPTIAWSVPIATVPSSPVWDSMSNNIFFTDSSGNIDFVSAAGTPSTYTSLAVAAGTTSENPVTVDSADGMVYATFNFNGTGASVVQAPVNLSSFVAAPLGLGNTLFTGPYGVDFSNAWYANGPTASGALLYVVGTDTTTGLVPMLYSVGFGGVTAGVMDTTTASSTALATTTNAVTTAATVADASDVTEFYNTTTSTDYLFVGVTDSCAATTGGGLAGCVMSLNITSGAPVLGLGTTALPAPGGTTGLVVDNDASTTPVTGFPQAASIYYGTKDGGTLVKATQSGLN